MSRLWPLLALLCAASPARAQDLPPVYPPPAPPMAPIIGQGPPGTQLGRPSKPKRAGSLISMQGLGIYRYVFHESFAGLGIELDVGGETLDGFFSLSARFSFAAGTTEGGIPFEHGQIGLPLTFHLSPRTRLGIGPELGLLLLELRHGPKEPVFTPNIGLFADLSVDAWRDKNSLARLFVMVRVSYDWFMVSTSRDDGHSLGLQAGLGFRF